VVGIGNVTGDRGDAAQPIGGLRERFGAARVSDEPPAALVERADECEAETP
jgi:hypothetical protein